MKDWKEMELGDVLQKIIGGGTPSKSKPEYWNGDINWCSVKDMLDDKFQISETQDAITHLGLINSASNLIPKNTVITSTRMGLGKAFISKKEMAINQDLKALIPNKKINNNFLLWLIIFNKNTLENLGSGATVKGIRLETLKSLKINLPPLPTQQKIADILSAYDDLIENNLKRIKLLEEQAQITYEEWFVRMRFPGFENTPIDKETGLPEGWKEGLLSDLVEFQNGFAFKGNKFSNSGFPIIKIKNIQNNTIELNNTNFIDDEYAAKVEKFKLNAGDLLIAMTGATIGKVGIVPITDKPCYLNQRVGKFLKKNTIDNIAFVNCFFSIGSGSKFIENIGGGSAQPNISSTQILSIPLIIPNKFLLKKFSELSINNIKAKLILQKQNQRLKEARDILLPRLMMGIIDVK